MFRVIRVFSGVPGSYGNTRKKQWASWAKWWKRGGKTRGPLAQTELDKEWGGAPLSSPLSPPSLSPTPTLGRVGVLLPVGVGLPLGCA